MANISNLNLLKCNKNLFSKEGLIKNVGFYIFINIIMIHVINIFIFYIKQFDLLKNNINILIFAIKNLNLINKNNKKKVPKKENNNLRGVNNKSNIENKIRINNDKVGKIKKAPKKNKKGNKKRNNMLKKKSRQTIDNNIINNSNNFNNIFNSNIALNINRNNNRNSNRNYNRNDNRNNDRNSNRNNNNLLTNSSKSQDKKTIEKVKQIMEYNEDEINTLEFHLALLFDKRSYCQYYISLLRTKHNFIFSFCHNNDYNSKIIKIDLFFIGFTIYYTVNALFYSDGTMHNIYVSNGSFNIEYQLPKIVYSSLIQY